MLPRYGGPVVGRRHWGVGMCLQIVRWGIYCYLYDPPPEVVALLKQELSYRKKIREDKFVGRRRVVNYRQQRRVLCELISDVQQVLPSRLVFPAGLLVRACRALKSKGYTWRVHDRLCLPTDPRRELSAVEWEQYWQPVRLDEERLVWRWRQQEALDAMSTALGGVLIAPTGYGKGTLIARFVQRFPQRRIDITTTSLDVLDTLSQRLQSEGVRDLGRVDGSVCRRGRVQLISARSLHKADGTADFLLVDEIQEFATDEYLAAISRHYRWARRFGFTANCWDRADRADFETEALFGPVIFYLSYPEAVEHGCVAPISVDWFPVREGRALSSGLNDTERKRRGIWNNAQRNRAIAQAVRQLPEEDQTLIFVETVEHALALWRELPDYELVYAPGSLTAEDRRYYAQRGWPMDRLPEMTAERKFMLRRLFETDRLKKVIATPVWSRGVDFSRLAVVVRADGQRSSVSSTQIPGRVSRVHEDKASGKIFDFVDYWDPGFLASSRQRYRDYRKHGWEQRVVQEASR